MNLELSYTLLWISLAVAAVDWLAVYREWHVVEYLAKPSVMGVLIAWLWSLDAVRGPLLWFALALVLSLTGDVLLMLPRERFLGGLVAFLLAHLAYVAGFNQAPPPVTLAGAILAVAAGLVTIRLFRRIASGLTARLRGPVLAYSIVISLMLISALLTLVRSDWSIRHALLVSAGALLFFSSDSLLAWTRFVTPRPRGKLAVIIPYHLGQMAITLGAVLHYLSRR